MKVCTVDGCERPHEGLNLCKVHYRRFKVHGSTDLPARHRAGPCTVDGCDRMAKARQLCALHVRRFYTHGTPTPPVRTDEDRFWAKVVKSAPDECWEIRASRHPKGHAYHSVDGRLTYAHRYALELALGRKLGPGKFACHHCDNPGCVNAAHLYEGDAQTNVDDMWRRGRANPKGLRNKRRADGSVYSFTTQAVTW